MTQAAGEPPGAGREPAGAVGPLAKSLVPEVAAGGYRVRLRLAVAMVALARPLRRRLVGPPAAPRLHPAQLRRRPALAWGVVVLILVTACVALVCYLAWAILAGQRWVLATEPSTPSLVTDIEDDRDGRARYSAPQLEDPTNHVRSLRSSGSGASGHTSGSAPATIDGTTLAIGLSALAIVVGIVVERAILRRLRRIQENHAAEGPGPDPQVDLVASERTARGGDVDAGRYAEVGTGELDLHAGVNAGGDCAAVVVEGRPEPVTPGDAVDGTGETRAAAGLSHMLAVPTAPTAHVVGALASAAIATEPVDRRVLFDRREQRRVTFHGRARLQWPGYDLACLTQSLDIRGIRCVVPATELDLLPPIGAPARITVKLDGVLISIGATVVWSRGDGEGYRIGLHFDVLDDLQRSQLLTFLNETEDKT